MRDDLTEGTAETPGVVVAKLYNWMAGVQYSRDHVHRFKNMMKSKISGRVNIIGTAPLESSSVILRFRVVQLERLLVFGIVSQEVVGRGEPKDKSQHKNLVKVKGRADGLRIYDEEGKCMGSLEEGHTIEAHVEGPAGRVSWKVLQQHSIEYEPDCQKLSIGRNIQWVPFIGLHDLNDTVELMS
jgi:hypothetical protein